MASIADTDSLFNGHDTEQPIEIVADNFTIDQDAKIATFEGRVEAIQGNLIFTTETLRVFYETKEGKDEPSIVRLDAAGRFRMESPSEVAEGDWAIYDIKSKTITIAGHVTLRKAGTQPGTANRVREGFLFRQPEDEFAHSLSLFFSVATFFVFSSCCGRSGLPRRC